MRNDLFLQKTLDNFDKSMTTAGCPTIWMGKSLAKATLSKSFWKWAATALKHAVSATMAAAAFICSVSSFKRRELMLQKAAACCATMADTKNKVTTPEKCNLRMIGAHAQPKEPSKAAAHASVSSGSHLKTCTCTASTVSVNQSKCSKAPMR